MHQLKKHVRNNQSLFVNKKAKNGLLEAATRGAL